MPRTRFWMLPVVVVLALAACGQRGGAAADSGPLRQADQAMTLGDLSRARLLLEGVLDGDPQSFAARYRLGALMVDESPREAMRELEDAAALEPGHPGPHGFAAMARYRLSDFDGAARELRAAWTLARARVGYSLPDTSEAVRKGLEALDQGRFAAAADTFAQVLAADSSQAIIWMLSGTALHRGGATDRAERAARQAVELDPDFPAARVLLASVWIAQRKLAEARRELDAVLADHPDLAEARYQLGVALGKENDYRDSALALWSAVLEDPTVPAYHQALGQILTRMDAADVGTDILQHAEWVRVFFDRQFGRGAFRRTR
jgi:tetratricopeptide (TPR) repeat protein